MQYGKIRGQVALAVKLRTSAKTNRELCGEQCKNKTSHQQTISRCRKRGFIENFRFFQKKLKAQR